jgi:hypothetical protein
MGGNVRSDLAERNGRNGDQTSGLTCNQLDASMGNEFETVDFGASDEILELQMLQSGTMPKFSSEWPMYFGMFDMSLPGGNSAMMSDSAPWVDEMHAGI